MSERQNFHTALTKVYVAGLPWTTRKESLRSFFQQFGEVIHANVICDRQTNRSKGYGFVTFKDAESAERACVDRNPIIDGRRANCKLASDCEKVNRNQFNITSFHHNDLCYLAPRFMQNQQQFANFHQSMIPTYNEPYYYWNQYYARYHPLPQFHSPYHPQPQFYEPYHPQPQFYAPYHPQPQYRALYYPQPYSAQHNLQPQYDPQSTNMPRENQVVSSNSLPLTPKSSLE